MHHRIYLHLVWTTRERAPLITAERARFLAGYLRATARHHDAYVLELGMVTTHVHALLRTGPSTVLHRLVQSLKGGSAAVGNRELATGAEPLRWARGYSAQSVNAKGLADVRAYLRAQPVRHPGEVIQGWDGDTPDYDREG